MISAENLKTKYSEFELVQDNVFLQSEKPCLLIIRGLYNKKRLKSRFLKSLSCAIKMFFHREIQTLCLCFSEIVADIKKMD